MGNDLAVIEQNLVAIKPNLAECLPKGFPVERLMRTVLVSLEGNPKLAECNPGSIMRAAMTAAVLGLEVDGVTGQGYLVPYGGQAQFQPGYKGYNTMAARSGYTITGDVVCEGDEFEYEKGTKPFVRHVPANKGRGRIIGAWAAATHASRPPVVEFLNLEELNHVRNKSQAVKQGKKDSPWFDTAVGLPAMYQKTVKRRLARSMPLNVMQWGAAVEEALEERGLPGHVTKDGPVIIEGDLSPIAPRDSEQEPLTIEGTAPVYRVALADNTERKFQDIKPWGAFMQQGFSAIDDLDRLLTFWGRNSVNWEDVNEVEPETADLVYKAYQARAAALTPTSDF